VTPRLVIGPGQLDIQLFQGATFDVTMVYAPTGSSTPFNLTGFSADMKVYAPGSIAEPIDELSVANGRIILGGTAGTIRLLIPSTDQENYIPSMRYLLELSDSSGNVTPLIYGNFIVVVPQ